MVSPAPAKIEPPADSRPAPAASRAVSVWERLAALLAGVLLIATVWQASIRINHALVINHVAGAWSTLARDAAEGTFYRPLVAPDAFGGTRFAPLYIALQAGLIRAGLAPLSAGHALNVLFAIAVAAGAAVWVRRLGVDRLPCFALFGTIFATETVRTLLCDIRSDTMAAALCVWALALWQRDSRGHAAHWSIVAILLGLAWATKLTSAYGIGVAVMIAFFDGRRKQAIFLGFVSVALAVVLYGAAQYASGGRMFKVFADCAGGGATLFTVLKSPYTFLWILSAYDPLGLLMFGYTVAVLFALAVDALFPSRDKQLFLPGLTLLATLAVTIVIFASPGTSLNHVIDIQIVGWVCLAAVLRRHPVPLAMTLIAIALIGLSIIWIQSDGQRESRKQQMIEALASVGKNDKPVLAENPSVLLLGNEPVYMLDAFMFRIAATKDPKLIGRLRTEMREHQYRGVVLMNDPRTTEGAAAIERTHFYPGFCDDLLESYRVVYDSDDNTALVPK